MERPELAPGADVEAHDVAARLLLDQRPIDDVRARENDVAHDDRCRVHRVVLERLHEREPLGRAHASAGAEVGVGLAGLGIERHQLGVVGAGDDASACPVGPVGRAAMGEPEIGRPAEPPRLRVPRPDCAARHRVECGDDAERRRGVEHAVHQQRRVLVAVGPRRIRLDDLVVRRAPAPRHVEPVHVRARDLVHRGVFRTRRITRVVAPLGGSHLRRLWALRECDDGSEGRQRDGKRERGWAHGNLRWANTASVRVRAGRSLPQRRGDCCATSSRRVREARTGSRTTARRRDHASCDEPGAPG